MIAFSKSALVCLVESYKKIGEKIAIFLSSIPQNKYMNDFFTELDSDLQGVAFIPPIPKNSIAEIKVLPVRRETAPHVATVPHVYTKAPIAHITTKEPREIIEKQEPREVREKGDMREEGISNFSVTGTPPNIFPRSKPQFLPILPKGQTRIVAIGGHNEIGKNMSMYQYGDEIVLVDSGIQFPENNIPGAKYSLPDISFLFPIKQKIVAVVITHGHLDHIGGLKHLLPALGYPKVYGTKLTIALIKRLLEDA